MNGTSDRPADLQRDSFDPVGVSRAPAPDSGCANRSAISVVILKDPSRKSDWEHLLRYLSAKEHIANQVVCLSRLSETSRSVCLIDHKLMALEYEGVSHLMEEYIKEYQRVLVLVDGIEKTADGVGEKRLQLNPIAEASWETLIARLILAFPEIRWLFARISDGNPDVKADYGLDNIYRPWVDPLFDIDGLRDRVREWTATGKDTGLHAQYLPRRRQHAYALDEEVSYACLHAYAAYRSGFRSGMLTTMESSDWALNPKHPAAPKFNPDLVFEDIYANFPDTSKHGLSRLYAEPENPDDKQFKGRAHVWGSLEKAAHRIFVTSGQRMAGASERWIRNRAYISSQKSRSDVFIRTLHKPYGGIYRLWSGSGLARKLHWSDRMTGKRYRGVAKEYIWPPKRSSFTDGGSGHSSPGALLLIADHLTARAEKLWDELDGSGSVEEAVRGAVLATDALELLGCRTPTQSIEALRLKHKFELLAECQFSGVEHHVCIKERIAEIRRDIRTISYWFGPRKRKLAAWNAEAQILTDLVRILRDHGHFDEEQYCMTNIRRAMRKIWLQDARPWSFLGYPFRWYVEILLDRPIYFAGAITLWTTLLFWFFMIHGIHQGGAASEATLHGWQVSLHETLATFFQTEIPQDLVNWWAVAVSAVAVLMGFVHLGIFISHLYTQVSRR